jgi:uncharacterized protein
MRVEWKNAFVKQDRPQPAGIRVASVLALFVSLLLVACSGGAAIGKSTTRPTAKPKRVTTRRGTSKPATSAKSIRTTSIPTTSIVNVVPVTSLPATLAAARASAPFEQFGEVRFTITNSAGKETEFCALLADTPANQEQGLMGQTDLAGYNAMLFTWPADTNVGFWMRTVPIWLSIAFWDGGGKFVSATDMAPCGDSANCPSYYAKAPFRVAMETLREGLKPLGVAPDSVLKIGGPCRKS